MMKTLLLLAFSIQTRKLDEASEHYKIFVLMTDYPAGNVRVRRMLGGGVRLHVTRFEVEMKSLNRKDDSEYEPLDMRNLLMYALKMDMKARIKNWNSCPRQSL